MSSADVKMLTIPKSLRFASRAFHTQSDMLPRKIYSMPQSRFFCDNKKDKTFEDIDKETANRLTIGKQMSRNFSMFRILN